MEESSLLDAVKIVRASHQQVQAGSNCERMAEIVEELSPIGIVLSQADLGIVLDGDRFKK